MATGLEMLYNAIGGAGGTLSGHLRESELRRLQVEAELRAQAERDALLEKTNSELADFDKKYAATKSQAQELGVQMPSPGSIDEQIFQATGNFGFTPIPRGSIGQTRLPVQGGGTQIPVSTPRTEWAPSQAEAAVSADAIRATKELLTGKPAIDTNRYYERLKLIDGLQRLAASRPSTSGMASTLGDQTKASSDFMTREGAIANDGRQLQGSIAGRFMDNRALSARDRQGTEYVQGQTNARNNADNATRESIARAGREADEKNAVRAEDKEIRLQYPNEFKAVKNDEAFVREANKDLGLFISEDPKMSEETFKARYPYAVIEREPTPFEKWQAKLTGRKVEATGKVKRVTNLIPRETMEDIVRRKNLLRQREAELAKRAGPITNTPDNPALSAGLGVPPVAPVINMNSAGYKL